MFNLILRAYIHGGKGESHYDGFIANTQVETQNPPLSVRPTKARGDIPPLEIRFLFRGIVNQLFNCFRSSNGVQSLEILGLCVLVPLKRPQDFFTQLQDHQTTYLKAVHHNASTQSIRVPEYMETQPQALHIRSPLGFFVQLPRSAILVPCTPPHILIP